MVCDQLFNQHLFRRPCDRVGRLLPTIARAREAHCMRSGMALLSGYTGAIPWRLNKWSSSAALRWMQMKSLNDPGRTFWKLAHIAPTQTISPGPDKSDRSCELLPRTRWTHSVLSLLHRACASNRLPQLNVSKHLENLACDGIPCHDNQLFKQHLMTTFDEFIYPQ